MTLARGEHVAQLTRRLDKIERDQAAFRAETRNAINGRLERMEARLTDLSSARRETAELIALFVRESK